MVEQQHQQQHQEMTGKIVRIDNDVHAELTELGKKNESYSNVIKRLVEFYKKEGMKSKK